MNLLTKIQTEMGIDVANIGIIKHFKARWNAWILYMKGDWRPTDPFLGDFTPPDKVRLEVMDKDGRRAFAFANWYPFKMEKRPGDERKPYGFRGTPVPCKPYWDGGWSIDVSDLNINKIGDVKFWRVPPLNDQFIP